MLLAQISKLRKYQSLRPFIIWGKRTFYVPYRAKQLNAGKFPREIWIENTNLCNARCIMCPRESLTRSKGTMDYQLFEKIIHEVALHKDVVQRVHLHNFGEPLIDKMLPHKIRLAKHLGLHHLYLVTNGSLLTEEMSKALIENGLDEFKVSFYGTDEESYNSTMKGLDYQRTLTNIRNFVRIRSEMRSGRPSIIIQYLPVDSDISKYQLFKQIVEPIIQKENGDRLNLFALHNYGGGKEYVPNGPVENICHYPWDTFLVLQDGSVSTCCFDYNGTQIIGHTAKSSIEELWQSERYRAIRNDFKNLNYESYPACKKCSMIRYPE